MSYQDVFLILKRREAFSSLGKSHAIYGMEGEHLENSKRCQRSGNKQKPDIEY
jgi:hypothetical protein